MMQNEGIGDQLKRRRAELSLTQQQLGQRVGASAITIRKLEAGARRPSTEMARALIKALSIPPKEHEAFLAMAGDATDERHEQRLDNGPRYFTPLVGREDALARARSLLLRNDTRLLTVLGPGGIGKTRFGVALAEGVVAQFKDGVYFVDLAAVHDATRVTAHILDSVSKTLNTSRDEATLALKRILKDKSALLVLDNFEQVTDATREVGELLLDCPQLKAIVTSRSALRIGLEKRFKLEPLALPSAIELFAQRMQAASEQPEPIDLDSKDAEAVAKICQLMEGLPLAIELVAARGNLMTPSLLLSRLQPRGGAVRLDLVADGLSDLPSRQKTLQRTLQWSYDLLSPSEQAIFRQLSVFEDGFTLDSAERLVLGEQPDPIWLWNMLTLLMDKSLIQKRLAVDEIEQPAKTNGARMMLLETVRLFATEKLAQQHEEHSVRSRHLQLFLGLAESAAQQWNSPEQPTWTKTLRQEYANLHAALEFAFATTDAATSLRFCAALWRFWVSRGQFSLGRHFCTSALGLAFSPETQSAELMDVRAKCLRGLGLMCERQGNYAEAKMHWLESQRLYQALGDSVSEASTRAALGIIAIDERDFVQAHNIFSESVAFCQQEGFTSGLASAYSNLGFIANAQAHYATAIQHFDDAIRLRRTHGSQTDLAWCLSQLGYAQLHSGDSQSACTSFLECLSLCQQVDDAVTMLDALEGMALIASCCNQAALGIQLYAASARHSAEMGTQDSPAHPIGPMSRDERLEALRNSLGPALFAENWQMGSALSLDEAVLLAARQIEFPKKNDAPIS